MKLLPIKQTIEENPQFKDHPDCQESLLMTIKFFNKIGYNPPWIGYYAEKNGQLVGTCAVFRRIPAEGVAEIAYGTFPQFQNQGIASEMCQQLLTLTLETDPSLIIIAHTLPEENYSTRILRKNGFELLGAIWDEEDGEIWKWVYKH
jgi:[ribosomal protein S5]-alanine N-acetyltransferase